MKRILIGWIVVYPHKPKSQGSDGYLVLADQTDKPCICTDLESATVFVEHLAHYNARFHAQLGGGDYRLAGVALPVFECTNRAVGDIAEVQTVNFLNSLSETAEVIKLRHRSH